MSNSHCNHCSNCGRRPRMQDTLQNERPLETDKDSSAGDMRSTSRAAGAGLLPGLAVLLLHLVIGTEEVHVEATASSVPALIVRSNVVDGAVCAPQKVEVSCHPSSVLVLSDNSPVEKYYRACAKIACHTDSLYIHNGYVEAAPALVAVGDSVRIRCNTGFELKYDSAKSSNPRCQSSCAFDPPQTCERKKCYTFSIDPNGRVQQMGQAVAVYPTKLEPLEYDQYVRITCNHGYMASDSAHTYNEACKVSYIRECRADGSLSNTPYEVSCVKLTCARLHAEHPADTWKPAGPLEYKKTASVECGHGRFFNGSTPVRECSWRCQYSEPQGACVYKPCITGTRPTTTEWAEGAAPRNFGDAGTAIYYNGIIH